MIFFNELEFDFFLCPKYIILSSSIVENLVQSHYIKETIKHPTPKHLTHTFSE